MRDISIEAESVLDEDGQDLAAILAVAVMRLGGTATFTISEFKGNLVLAFDVQYMREHPGSIRLEAHREEANN